MLNGADYILVYEAQSPPEASPTLASVTGRRLNLYLWVLLAITNFADVLATGRALEIGIEELNPIVNIFHAEFGISGIAVVKALFLTLLFFLLPWIRTWTRTLFSLACAIYLALTVAHIGYLSPLL